MFKKLYARGALESLRVGDVLKYCTRSRKEGACGKCVLNSICAYEPARWEMSNMILDGLHPQSEKGYSFLDAVSSWSVQKLYDTCKENFKCESCMMAGGGGISCIFASCGPAMLSLCPGQETEEEASENDKPERFVEHFVADEPEKLESKINFWYTEEENSPIGISCFRDGVGAYHAFVLNAKRKDNGGEE